MTIERVSSSFLHSPFRYQGHQSYALGNILTLIPKHNIFVEPFCGGAGVFFGKSRAEANWLNDINSELMDVYTFMRDSPQDVLRFINKKNVSAERYKFINEIFTPLKAEERVARWFYLNRTSCLESMDKFWLPDKDIQLDVCGLKEIVLRCSDKLQGVKLTSGDFETAIENAPNNSFIFVAPPYSLNHSSVRAGAYRHPFLREDHLRLARVLHQHSDRVRFMLTYRDCPEIRAIYSSDHFFIRELISDNQFINDLTKKESDQIKTETTGREEIAVMNYNLTV